MLSGFQPTDKIRNSEGVDVPLSEVSVGDKLIGIDYNTEEFDGANVNLNKPVLDAVISVSTRTTENAIRLTFSDDRTMIVDAQTQFYSRPLPCGDVEHEDGTITDRATGLMWSQSDSGTGMTWKQALPPTSSLVPCQQKWLPSNNFGGVLIVIYLLLL